MNNDCCVRNRNQGVRYRTLLAALFLFIDLIFMDL